MPELRPMQRAVLEPLRERFIHADPPGTGKTPVGWRWLQAHDAQRSLLVVPRNVLRHWERLATVWAPEYTTAVVPIKTLKKKRLDIMSALHDVDGPKALIVPYSVLREDIDVLIAFRFDAFLADEAHKLKNRGAQVTKAAAKLSWRSPVVDLTTASPLLNSPDEAWTHMHFIDRNRWPSYHRWVDEHFWTSYTDFHGTLPRPIKQIGEPRPGALAAIRAEFGDLLVMRDEDELGMDMPDLVETSLEVDLTPAERRIYDSMAKHFWLKEGERVVFASNEVAKITRLRQLTSDWSAVLDNDVADDGTKVQAAAELIDVELSGRSVVVFAQYKGTARRLVARLNKMGIPAAAYTGDEDDDARQDAFERFTSREVQVLVGTDATMAEGLDGLQHVSNHMIVLDPDWVPEIRNQKIGRLKRDGQPEPSVFVYYILARNTVDQTVELSREHKKSVIDEVVGHSLKEVLHGSMSKDNHTPCLTSRKTRKPASTSRTSRAPASSRTSSTASAKTSRGSSAGTTSQS